MLKRSRNCGDIGEWWGRVFSDLIGRHVTARALGTRLAGGITCLRTGEGWLYLATVIDLSTPMLVGWAMADHMRASLCVNALTLTRARVI